MTVPHNLSPNIDGTSHDALLDLPDDADLDDRYMVKLRNYAKSLPYSIEPYPKMMELLDLILLRITQCIEAKDYDVGLVQWDSMLT
jgi:proteasome activator subunit 4